MKIPRTHKSPKAVQDFIEDDYKKKIREATPGTARHDWLVWDFYCWIQNGKPVFGEFKKFIHDRDGHGHKETLYQHHSKSDRTAYDDLNEEKRRRRIK